MDIYHQLLLNDARSKKDSVTCNADPEVLAKVNGIYDKLGEIGGLCPVNGNPSATDPRVLQKITEISRKLSDFEGGSANSDTTLLGKIDSLSRSLSGIGNSGNIDEISKKLEIISSKLSAPGSNVDVIARINESSSNIITALSSKDGDRFMESMTKDRQQFENLQVIMDDPSKIHVMSAEEVNRVDKDPKTMNLFNSINQHNPSRVFSNKIKAHFYFLMLTSTPFQNKTLLRSVVSSGNITETFVLTIFKNMDRMPRIIKTLVEIGKTIGKISKNSTGNDLGISNDIISMYPLLVFSFLFQYEIVNGKLVPKSNP